MGVSAKMDSRTVRIPSRRRKPGGKTDHDGTPSDADIELLAMICTAKGHEPANGHSSAVIYLHGFPDLSVHPAKHDFASRLPSKICDAVLAADASCAFVCFNFSGVVGSDAELAFYDKTVSQEVC